MEIVELVKLLDSRLGKRIRRTDPQTRIITEGEVDLWLIQKSMTREPEAFLQFRGTYTAVSLHETELIED